MVRLSYRKGKTYEELYGLEKSNKIKAKQSISAKQVSGRRSTESYRLAGLKGSKITSKERRGKKWEDIYGKEKANKRILKLSIAKKEEWSKRDRETWFKNTNFGKINKPTSIEKKLIEFFSENNLPYKYVGDMSFWIGKCNPDFVNINGEKIAVEVYEDYWKKRNFGSTERYIEKRKSQIKEYGWDTLFIHFSELENQKELLQKIILFETQDRCFR